MSLSLYTNEPSPLNTTFCGAGINLLRSKLTNDSEEKVKSASFNKFFCLSGMALLGFSSILEASGRTLIGLVSLPIYSISPHSLRSFMERNARATLASFKIFSVLTNHMALVSLVALSALPNSFKSFSQENEQQKESLKQLGHQSEVGSCAFISYDSFLNSSYFGKKINEIRKAQTELELNTTTKIKKIQSRLTSLVKYMSYGLLSGGEACFNLGKVIVYSIYLKSKNSDTKYDKIVEKINESAKKFFTSLAIFSLTIDLKFLLITTLEHFDPKAYNVPDEVKTIYDQKTIVVDDQKIEKQNAS